MLEKRVHRTFSYLESDLFIHLAAKVCTPGNEQDRIRADNLTERELEIVRNCYRVDNMEGGCLKLTDFFSDRQKLYVARRLIEGLELYRVEMLPEFYRAIGQELTTEHIDYVYQFASQIGTNARNQYLRLLTSFEQATESEREQFEDGDDIRLFIDIMKRRFLVKSEYKLED